MQIFGDWARIRKLGNTNFSHRLGTGGPLWFYDGHSKFSSPLYSWDNLMSIIPHWEMGSMFPALESGWKCDCSWSNFWGYVIKSDAAAAWQSWGTHPWDPAAAMLWENPGHQRGPGWVFWFTIPAELLPNNQLQFVIHVSEPYWK